MYTVREKCEKRYCPHPHRCPPLLRPRPPPPFSSAHPHPPAVCGQRKNIFSSHQPYTSLKLHSPPTSGHRRLTPPRHHNHPCHRRTTTLVPVLECPLLREGDTGMRIRCRHRAHAFVVLIQRRRRWYATAATPLPSQSPPTFPLPLPFVLPFLFILPCGRHPPLPLCPSRPARSGIGGRDGAVRHCGVALCG